MSNEESIWVMDYKNQLIREKVMMEKPSNFDNYTNGFPEGAFFKSELKVFDEYKKHLASRRTFSYAVSKEQDGKEIPESEFRLQHQTLPIRNDMHSVYMDCNEDEYNSTKPDFRRIIAIPIESEPKDGWNIGDITHWTLMPYAPVESTPLESDAMGKLKKIIVSKINELASIEGELVSVNAIGNSVSIKFKNGNKYWVKLDKQSTITRE